ncbi:hypothetical protein [Microbacterium arborescens]
MTGEAFRIAHVASGGRRSGKTAQMIDALLDAAGDRDVHVEIVDTCTADRVIDFAASIGLELTSWQVDLMRAEFAPIGLRTPAPRPGRTFLDSVIAMHEAGSGPNHGVAVTL